MLLVAAGLGSYTLHRDLPIGLGLRARETFAGEPFEGAAAGEDGIWLDAVGP